MLGLQALSTAVVSLVQFRRAEDAKRKAQTASATAAAAAQRATKAGEAEKRRVHDLDLRQVELDRSVGSARCSLCTCPLLRRVWRDEASEVCSKGNST